MTERRTNDDLARKRYYTIATTRLAGAISIVLAIVALQDGSDWPPFFGYGLLVLGVIGMLVIPQIMVRKWRTPKDEPPR